MRNLEKQARLEVTKQMSYCFVTKNTVIFEQESIGVYFYIVKEGKVNLFIDQMFKKSLCPGDSFGDLALLYGATRSGTVKAVEDTYMWCLERKKFKQIVDFIANKNFEESKSFIKSIPMFMHMDINFITRLSMAMISVIYDPGTYIIKEGESSECIYIIKEGSVVCSKKDKLCRSLNKGDSFGLLSILIDSPRTMNVIAKTTCECYSISVKTMIDLLGPKYKDTLFNNCVKIAMSKSKYLSRLNKNLLELTYSAFKPATYDKNSLVFKKGTPVDEKIVIVLEGLLMKLKPISSKNCVTTFSDERKSVVCERGAILFEDLLFSIEDTEKSTLDYNIYADPDCLLMEASLVEFVKRLGGSFHEIMEKSALLESLSKVPLFKDFPMNKIKTIADNINIENFKHSQNIIQEGEDGSKFYIVKTGKVDFYVKNQYIRSLNDYDFFGERSLIIQEPRSATAIANGPVSLYVLSKDHFVKMIDDNFKHHLVERLALQDNTIELSDLDYIKHLGSGNFGNVYLVNSIKKNRMYALKAIAKNQIDQEQLQSNLEMERKILLQIDHPFIMKLVKNLKDDQDIYFLMEFVRGKELWDVIREIGVLTKDQAQFYGCSMLLAIDYLHSRRFVYRDIKPENVMINDKVNFSS
jgi:cGMP-dependent protein kinase